MVYIVERSVVLVGKVPFCSLVYKFSGIPGEGDGDGEFEGDGDAEALAETLEDEDGETEGLLECEGEVDLD